MSVLVPFMKMPKTCDDCQVSCDCPHDEHIDGYMMEKPSRFCPLRELPATHGDLIDTGELLYSLDASDFDDSDPIENLDNVIRIIGSARVIIPGEGEKT